MHLEIRANRGHVEPRSRQHRRRRQTVEWPCVLVQPSRELVVSGARDQLLVGADAEPQGLEGRPPKQVLVDHGPNGRPSERRASRANGSSESSDADKPRWSASSRSSGTARNPSSVGATPARSARRWARPRSLRLGNVAERSGQAVDPGEEVLGGLHPQQREDRAPHPPTGRAMTRDGSPPNAAMLVWTHSSASSQSRHRPVGRRALDPAEAVEPEPVGDAYRHDAVPVERPAVVPGAGGRPGDVPAAVDPHENRPPLSVSGRRRVDVDVQGRLAGDRRLGDEGDLGEGGPLSGRAVPEGVADTAPGVGRQRCGEPQGLPPAARRRGCRGRRPTDHARSHGP